MADIISSPPPWCRHLLDLHQLSGYLCTVIALVTRVSVSFHPLVGYFDSSRFDYWDLFGEGRYIQKQTHHPYIYSKNSSTRLHIDKGRYDELARTSTGSKVRTSLSTERKQWTLWSRNIRRKLKQKSRSIILINHASESKKFALCSSWETSSKLKTYQIFALHPISPEEDNNEKHR